MNDTTDTTDERRESVKRLTKDLKDASKTMGAAEARFLVDCYYTSQEDRKRAANQRLALTKSDEPNLLLDWLAEQSMVLERQIALALDTYSDAQPLGKWARSVVGIGPILAAGLLAHIDIRKAPTAGHIWAFGGLDPTRKWEKGKKRPHNAALKRLFWLCGESFVKFSGDENDVYGKLYIKRKAIEIEKNRRGEFAAQAAVGAARVDKKTEAYLWYSACLTVDDARTVYAAESGSREGMVKKLAKEPGSGVAMLPPGHIHSRAKRWAVKIFVAHYHHMAYHLVLMQAPPLPYPIAMMEGHTHIIDPPEWTLR